MLPISALVLERRLKVVLQLLLENGFVLCELHDGTASGHDKYDANDECGYYRGLKPHTRMLPQSV